MSHCGHARHHEAWLKDSSVATGHDACLHPPSRTEGSACVGAWLWALPSTEVGGGGKNQPGEGGYLNDIKKYQNISYITRCLRV